MGLFFCTDACWPRTHERRVKRRTVKDMSSLSHIAKGKSDNPEGCVRVRVRVCVLAATIQSERSLKCTLTCRRCVQNPLFVELQPTKLQSSKVSETVVAKHAKHFEQLQCES